MIYLNAEDSANDTIRPRLRALGADLDRIYVPEPGDLLCRDVTFPSRIADLDTALAEHRPRLLVLDPVAAFLDPSILENNDLSVRRALGPLARLADDHACAILLIRHLNKQPGANSLYRGTGTIGFLAACRTGWLAAIDPDRKTRRILAQTKNNLAELQPSLAFQIATEKPAGETSSELRSPLGEERPGAGSCLPSPLGGEGPGVRGSEIAHCPHSTVYWLGESPLTADDLVGAKLKRGPSPEVLDRACDFLREQLRNVPQPSRTIWQAAQQQGIGKSTLHRVRKELGVEHKRIPTAPTGVYYWRLPDQPWPEHLTHDDEGDLEPWLAPMRERFPPPTPLDELEE